MVHVEQLGAVVVVFNATLLVDEPDLTRSCALIEGVS